MSTIRTGCVNYSDQCEIGMNIYTKSDLYFNGV